MRLSFLLSLSFISGCSDYNINSNDKSPTPLDTGREVVEVPVIDTAIQEPIEEECNGIDDDGDGEVDEGFDENGNGIPDCTEEESYCTPFDDFSDWSYVGDGNWHIENGVLTEGRGGLYDAVAWVSDQGGSERFYMEVEVAWSGALNDLSGLAWAVDQNRYFAVRWDDPQGDYQRHQPPGAIDLVWCEDGSCTVLAKNAKEMLFRPSDMGFSHLAVAVDGMKVKVTVDGKPVLKAIVPEVQSSGPGVVGLYSNDNDGGVWFDNFCVWIDGA